MESLARSIDVHGAATRCFEQGDGPREVLLLHGGGRSGLLRPNMFAWEFNIGAFSGMSRTLAIDTLGHGTTSAVEADFQGSVGHLVSFMQMAGLRRPHLVGHDEGGLAALVLGLTQPDMVASVTITGSCAAPLGDAIPNLTLAGPPAPQLSKRSQAWVLERTSHTHHHVAEGRFLAEAVRLARDDPRDEAARAAKLAPSIARARSECFARLRDNGIAVPILLVWGLQDRLIPLENALELYRLITPRQRHAQMAVINQAGNMPFREQPTDFDRAVISFILAQ